MHPIAADQFAGLESHLDELAEREPLRLRTDPRAISDAGLMQLCRWGGKLRTECPTFGQWFTATLQAELTRRKSEDTRRPLENPLPSIDLVHWPDADVADALRAVTFASFIIDEATALRFIRLCLMVLLADARIRLSTKG